MHIANLSKESGMVPAMTNDTFDPDSRTLTRRSVLQGLAAAAGLTTVRAHASAAVAAQTQPAGEIGPLPTASLPAGVRSRFVTNVNGLRMHILEAGFETPDVRLW